MAILDVIANFKDTLADAITASATTGTLSNGVTKDGNDLPNGTYGFTIDEGTTEEEHIVATITGGANTALTSMLRGISFEDGVTEVTALKKAHRRGAEIKMTDHPTLKRIIRILTAVDAMTTQLNMGGQRITNVATPVSGTDAANKDYVLSVAMGGTLSINRVIESGTAGETIAEDQLVYLKSSDGRWWKCDADTAATVENIKLGIAQGAGTAGGAISGGVLRFGEATMTGLTANTTYYASNTAGAISTTPGTVEVTIGYAISTTTLQFEPRFNQTITEDLQDALAGNAGTPSSSNLFVTAAWLTRNISSADSDQSQTTQNGTVETGEADSTTRKNLIAQSFIPTKTNIRGVKLSKQADTGTFVGTVVISLQADSSGSPSGSNLASVTLTNAQWLALGTGEFTALFDTEYASMTPGSLYWIVIDPSTSDTSNHPNLGTNTAGGYSSGSVKYKNTTDGWVAISTIDLYFKTLEGIISQTVKTNSSGKIDNSMINIPLNGFQQTIPALNKNASTRAYGSKSDGSAFYSYDSSNNLTRYQRDAKTGSYYRTHRVTGTPSILANKTAGIVQIGSSIYVVYATGGNVAAYRYNEADLTSETLMTVPVVAATGHITAWTDGTSLYLVSEDSSTTSRKWTVSGTTFSASSTATVAGSTFGRDRMSSMWDGTYAYLVEESSGWTVRKLTNIMGTSISSSTISADNYTDRDDGGIIININADSMYLGTSVSVYDETAVVAEQITLIPFTKP